MHDSPINKTSGPRFSRPRLADVEYEELIVRRGRRTGAYAVIAIHSTVLGPALGPVRIWGSSDPTDAITDSLRIAKLTGFQSALANLAAGGGAGAICIPGPEPASDWERTELLHDFGELVESLDGRFIATCDAGLSQDDMVTLAGPTEHLAGLPRAMGGLGDPRALAALGVEVSIRRAVQVHLGAEEMNGLRVGVIGLGAVGSLIAERLSHDGSEVVAADIDPARQTRAAEIGATWLSPGEIITAECDVLVPCAPALELGSGDIEAMRASVVCGPACDALADDALAVELHERGVLFVPAELAGWGGPVCAAAERQNATRSVAVEQVVGLGDRLERLLVSARQANQIPQDLARTEAMEALEREAGRARRARLASERP